MGYFKEENYEFEQLAMAQPDYGFNTNNNGHTEFVDRIRVWMKNMADLRYEIRYFDKFGNPSNERDAQKRIDIYFIAWEQDEFTNVYRGTEYKIVTTRFDGFKRITLDANSASYSPQKFNRK